MLRRWLRDLRRQWLALLLAVGDFYSPDNIAAWLDRKAEELRAFNERNRP